jgi:hypothetical protein
MPQVCDSHERRRHALSVPAQSVGRSHPPQTLPAHVAVPPAHGVLGATGGFEGVPFVQTSRVHSRPSTGRSVSSTTGGATPPAPSQ